MSCGRPSNPEYQDGFHADFPALYLHRGFIHIILMAALAGANKRQIGGIACLLRQHMDVADEQTYCQSFCSARTYLVTCGTVLPVHFYDIRMAGIKHFLDFMAWNAAQAG